MHIAVLSDIHGNYEALREVLHRCDNLGADAIYCCGDIVGYGPYPCECVDLVRSACTGVVGGNHDYAAAGCYPLRNFNIPGRKVLRWTSDRLPDEHKMYLGRLPRRIEAHDCTFVHSSPADADGWTYLLGMAEVGVAMKAFTTSVCFVGHSHIPFIAREDGLVGIYLGGVKTIINVGSVGQPRGGGPDAAFGWLDTTKGEYQLIRVPYNFDRTVTAIHENNLPSILAKRLLGEF